MTAKNYYTIGELAKLTGLSIQTLRYYDRIALFKPAYVDPHNQYRYYRVDQLFYLHIIKYLRFLEVNVADIRQILTCTPAEINAFLATQSTVIAQKINKLEQIQATIAQHRQQLHLQTALNQQPFGVVYRREVPTQTALLLDCDTVITPLVQPDRTFNLLYQELTANDLAAEMQYSCLYPLQAYPQLQDIHYTQIYTPIMATDLQLTKTYTATFPQHQALCIAFKWAHETYLAQYQKLWQASQQYPIASGAKVHEISLPNHYGAAKADFITELHIALA